MKTTKHGTSSCERAVRRHRGGTATGCTERQEDIFCRHCGCRFAPNRAPNSVSTDCLQGNVLRNGRATSIHGMRRISDTRWGHSLSTWLSDSCW